MEEEEIIVLDAQIRHLAVNDPMRIGDNQALLCLPEDLLEGNDRHTLALDERLQETARAHGRELVAVTDENDPAAEPDRPQQMREQQHIDHGHLVHDENVAFEGIFLVMREFLIACRVKLHLQQAMDGLGFIPGQIRDTLGGTSGRCSDHDLVPLLLEAGNDGIEGRGLTGAGTAGEDQESAGQS